jgi:hypothetical protein
MVVYACAVCDLINVKVGKMTHFAVEFSYTDENFSVDDLSHCRPWDVIVDKFYFDFCFQ